MDMLNTVEAPCDLNTRKVWSLFPPMMGYTLRSKSARVTRGEKNISIPCKSNGGGATSSFEGWQCLVWSQITTRVEKENVIRERRFTKQSLSSCARSSSAKVPGSNCGGGDWDICSNGFNCVGFKSDKKNNMCACYMNTSSIMIHHFICTTSLLLRKAS
jgi:hypothetical protein